MEFKKSITLKRASCKTYLFVSTSEDDCKGAMTNKIFSAELKPPNRLHG